MKDGYTIYFVDSKNNVIISADFGFHYIIKTKGKNYLMSEKLNPILRGLLRFKF